MEKNEADKKMTAAKTIKKKTKQPKLCNTSTPKPTKVSRHEIKEVMNELSIEELLAEDSFMNPPEN